MVLDRRVLSAVCVAAFVSCATASASEVTQGKKVFVQHCAVCHYANRTATKVGPGLKGLFQKAKLKTGAAVNEENVRQFIESGHDGMPPFKSVLSKAEIDDLVDYLKTV